MEDERTGKLYPKQGTSNDPLLLFNKHGRNLSWTIGL